MKLFLSLTATNFYRSLFSKRFLFSVLGVTVVLFMTSFGRIGSGSDVISVFMISGSGDLVLIMGVLPLLPFAMSFAMEWEERSAGFWMIRTGIRDYAISKVIVSAATGTLVTFAGVMLYVSLLLIKLPLYNAIDLQGNPYAPLLEAGMPVSYLLAYTFHMSLSSALFATAALWISTYIPNPFTTLAAPIVLYFFLVRLTITWGVPEFLNLTKIVEGPYHAGSPALSLLVKFGTVLLLCLMMGYGTVAQVRRRVQYD